MGAPFNMIPADLSIFDAAGPGRAQRERRIIRHFTRIRATILLMTDLMQDGCRGNPDLCAPLTTQPHDRPCPQKDAP